MATDTERVLQSIDREELAQVALALGNIDSPTGHEKPVGDFVTSWLKEAGLKTRVICMVPDRPNVLGTLEGTGGGYSLLFNSHMDTTTAPRDVWTTRDTAARVHHSAWREGGVLYGEGIINDKGPMACFLMAAKAIRKAGVTLKGDLIVTAVSGEIEQEPVDEFQGFEYISADVGTRYMVTHGGMADYAVCVEATNCHLGWTMAGRAIFKITVFGPKFMYAPYLNRPYAPEKNPSAIVQMSRLVSKLEDWALTYQRQHTYESPGGTVVPRVNFGAVRGGSPYNTCVTSELCSLYLDFRTAPGQNVMDLKAELQDIVRSLGVEGQVELFLSRRGYEAQKIDPVKTAVEGAHQQVFKEKPQPVLVPESSMWRDINVFSEAGIPCVQYGPGVSMGFSQGKAGTMGPNLVLDDMYRAAQVFVLTALDLCNRDRAR